MNTLSLTDVEQMVHLVAAVSDPTIVLSLPERKRRLLEGLARLVDADAYIWSTAAPNPDVPGDGMTTCIVDGGWEGEEEQARVYEMLTNPAFTAKAQYRVTEAAQAGRFTTFTQDDLMTPDEWSDIGKLWLTTGFEHILLTIYPLSPQQFSGIGFHRRRGRPPFGERERLAAHVVFSQVDWLHRHGELDDSAKVLQLTPRERQVLIFLLGGDSKKQIAYKLKLSEHTVGDYMKSLHRRFSVNSRAELQAIFLTGSRN